MSTFHEHDDAQMNRLVDEANTQEQLLMLVDLCTQLEFGCIDSHILADLAMARLVLITLGPSAMPVIEPYVRCIKEEWWYA